MELSIFIKGFIIGISIAAPLGPIGLLCMQRTLNGGNIHGLVTGLGAATADAVYGVIAAFGLTFVSNFLIEQQTWFRLIGGFFLCYLGIKAFMSKPADQSATGNFNHAGSYGSTFILTLTNPMTILFFTAVFAGLGMADTKTGYASACLMVAGVFMGSCSWWILLSFLTNIFREKFTENRLAWANKISGTIILTFGLISLLSMTMKQT